MKIPLGILLSNKEFAENKILISPLEVKPHLKLPSGTILYKKEVQDTQTPIDKIKQVLDKLQERAQKAKDPRYITDAFENMDKVETFYFNNNHEIVETKIVLVNIAFSSDLEYPDGNLFKILSTLYPKLYPYPDGKLKFSEIVNQLETKQIQILNDIALPYQDAFIVEHKDILDKNKYILLREKLGTLLKPYKRKDLFDLTSDGKEIIRENLFSYTKKFLSKKDDILNSDMENNPDVQAILNGDPEIYYRYIDSREGIYIADNNSTFLNSLKTFLKRNYFKVVGESISLKESDRAIQDLNPKYLFLGSLESDSEFDIKHLEALMQNSDSTQDNPLNIFVFLNKQNSNLETVLRSKGISFIFSKQKFIDGESTEFERLKTTFNLFETSN